MPFLHSVSSEGAYREVYLSTLHSPVEETVVFKAYYWGSGYRHRDFEYMRMDAIVSEKLSSSPRIVNIYGFCGTSMINEAMVHGDLFELASALDEPPDGGDDPLIVFNNLTGTQKLNFALGMAEALAVVHSYPGGVIVHDDVKAAQFLITDEGGVKLNDFNRAEIMLFNEKDQEYCRYRNGGAHGNVSSHVPGSSSDDLCINPLALTYCLHNFVFGSGVRLKSTMICH